MEDIFTQLKEKLSITEVLNMYGVKVGRHNKALCCFHKEKTPSFKIYTDTNRYYCFGCGNSGTIIDFVGKMFNLNLLDVANKLNVDFNLGLTVGKQQQMDIQQIHKQHKNNQLLQAFRKWECETCDDICEQIQICERIKIREIPFSDAWCAAIKKLSTLEYHWTILFKGSVDEKIQLCRGWLSVERYGNNQRIKSGDV